MATNPISSATTAVADLSAGAAIANAATTALKRAGASATTTVIDAIATAAAGELGRAITGAPAKKTAKAGGTKTSATTKKTTTKGYATTTKAKEFAFLDDPKMSIEEKLFRFLQAMSKKSNDDLLKKMKEFRAEKNSSKPKLSGGALGMWSALKKAAPALGIAEKILGDKALGAMLKEFSGPMLAAAATALGAPALAPVLMKLGPEVLKSAPKVLAALDAIPVTGFSAAAGTGDTEVLTTTGAKADGKKTFSKEEAMELEWMMQQQQQLFSTISNTLKAMHETKMAVINNIR